MIERNCVGIGSRAVLALPVRRGHTPSMLRLLLPFLLGAFAAASGEANAAAPPRRACTEGTSEPDPFGRLRPSQTAACNYDVRDFNRRVVSLLDLDVPTLTVDTIERIFGLPKMHTAFDSAWSADYRMTFSGPTPWQVMLSFDEGFLPQAGSPRFRGTIRPVLIRTRHRGRISLGIHWFEPSDARPGSSACLSTDSFAREARRRGWRVRQNVYDIADIGPQQILEITRGRVEITLPWSGGQSCITRFELRVEQRDEGVCRGCARMEKSRRRVALRARPDQ